MELEPIGMKLRNGISIIGLPESFSDNIFSTATFPTGS